MTDLRTYPLSGKEVMSLLGYMACRMDRAPNEAGMNVPSPLFICMWPMCVFISF